MQIVIDIDENVFTRLFDNGIEDYAIVNDDLFAIAKSIRKGTPLPKGHGRLCDLDALWYKLHRLKEEHIISDREFDDFATLLGLIPIVLKADKEAVDANSN